MKTIKLGLLASVSILLFASCGSNNSVIATDQANETEWEGVYSNVIPCADCEGIQMTIVLHKDMTYERMSKYLGKDISFYTEKGTFSWDKKGKIITLDELEHAPYKYLVGENELIQFDMDGKALDKETQAKYTLGKVSDIIGKNWKLIELNKKEISSSGVKEPHFILSVESNRISGTGDCNSFNGTYILTNGNGITISPLASTMVACPNMQTESELFRVMELVDNYTIEQDTLLLNTKTELLAKFIATKIKDK